MADTLLFLNIYIEISGMFCYVKFVQHTETNNIKNKSQAAGTISGMANHHD